jgi:thioesterase domain-containing protein
LARGYHNRPELTAEKFIPDPLASTPGDRLYKTGDLARFLSDGSSEYLGRLDHQVKIRGFRIELGEVEDRLTQHPSVREALAVVGEDSPGGKFLAAYLISKNGELADDSELREFLLSKLPEYMVPSVFIKIEQFPLTPNGKVDRKALPKPKFKSSMAVFSPPKSPAEKALARIWCDVLQIKQVGVRESFFEIGGHSLLAMRLASRIKRDLNVDLPVRAIFQHPTIESLASQISLQQVGGRKSELIHLQSGGQGPDLIFLVDEGSLGLFKLAYLLDKGFPLYISVSPLPESALRASAENRLDDLPTMESLAADHVRLIQTRQSGRPIILVGHCFGGELALEVARQLQKAGEQIETILMLDTWMAQKGRWWNKKTWLQAHFKKLWREGPSYFWRKTQRRIYLKRDDLAKKLKLMSDGDYNLHVPWFVILRIYRQARAYYRREVLPLPGILFLSQDDWESNAYRKIDNTLGTGKWFGGGIEVVEVPGDHVTVLEETHLPRLALAFNAILGRIYGDKSTKSNVKAEVFKM